MVEVFRFKNLKFKINSNDHPPAHVHVNGGSSNAKININSLEILASYGFSNSDLKIIQQQVFIRKLKLLEKWEELHGKDKNLTKK